MQSFGHFFMASFLAKKKSGISNLHVELDALIVVQFMINSISNQTLKAFLFFFFFYIYIHKLLKEYLLRTIPNKQIEHIFRKLNFFADAFARFGQFMPTTHTLFNNPPFVMEDLLIYQPSIRRVFLVTKSYPSSLMNMAFLSYY